MPLKSGASKAVEKENFHESRHGKTFARTQKKFGKKKAVAQMVAAVLTEKGKSIGEIHRAGRK